MFANKTWNITDSQNSMAVTDGFKRNAWRIIKLVHICKLCYWTLIGIKLSSKRLAKFRHQVAILINEGFILIRSILLS